MEVSDQLHTWLLHLQGKSPWYPLDRRLGGLQSQSRHGGEEKKSQPLLGLKPPIIKSVAQHCTTELSWLPSETMYMEKTIAHLSSLDTKTTHSDGVNISEIIYKSCVIQCHHNWC
jgi:hypothetical protein